MAAHNSASYYLSVLFFLQTIAGLSTAASTTDSSLCDMPSPAPEHLPAGEDALPLLRSFELTGGYFFGGQDIDFPEEENSSSPHITRSVSLHPLHVDRTADSTLYHVSATLTLFDVRVRRYTGTPGRQRHRYVGRHSVTFFLEGYFSSTSMELCMAGSGTYHSRDDGSLEYLLDVVLQLRVPNPSSLREPFVTGRLKGAAFNAISLVAYAEDVTYRYDESASCPPPPEPASTARGTAAPLQALGGGGANFSCALLTELLVNTYKLQYGGAGTSSSSGAPSRLPWPQEPRMHIGQVRCAANGGSVRVYGTLSNNTDLWWAAPGFTVREEALVAEGLWNSTRSTLCLSACRVVRSGPGASAALEVKECGIGMSLWFPGVWTFRDVSVVAGALWNSSKAAGSNDDDGGSDDVVVSLSSTGFNGRHMRTISGVKYSYNDTMVGEARKHHQTLKSQLLGSYKKQQATPFVAPNYTYHDFEFRFYEAVPDTMGTTGPAANAYPISISSTVVYGDQLAADYSISELAVVDAKESELLNVSYVIHHYVGPVNSWERRKLRAEGVFDLKTGIMCMIGCQEHNSSTEEEDCKILVTVHFASLDAIGQGHGAGAISSLRDKTDPLFFDKIRIRLYGMYSEQVAESISRMDLESVLLVASTTLPCVFTALQILHAKRHPDASAATSITMLALMLALWYAAPLLLSSETLFLSRRTLYDVSMPLQSYVPYELSQAMMRAPTLIALLLQLRLIQLAWSARRNSDRSGEAGASAAAAAERRALWLCLPLYLIGGALTVVAHAVNVHRAALEDLAPAVRIGPEPATLWEDLVASAGLALDAFLLPQVVMNAFVSAGGGGCRVVRALSPWFYVGGTAVRAMPRVYDVVRSYVYVPSLRPSYIYADPRYDRFGVAWDVAAPCAAGLLAALLFLQQRVRVAAPLLGPRRRLGEYEMAPPL